MTDTLNSTQQKFTALILAADRASGDPVAQYAGVACKAFAPVGGIPMILRVIDALSTCDLVDSIMLCGPPQSKLDDCPSLKKRIDSGELMWLSNQNSPSRSAEHGLNHLPVNTPVFLTTADHALLTPDIVEYFLAESLRSSSDATVGLITNTLMTDTFPGTKRTVFHLRDGGICGCNLFTFNPQGRALIKFWRTVEDLRKQPWRLIAHLVNPGIVLSYVFRRLSLEKALDMLAAKSGVRVSPVLMSDARAGIDVDKVEDLLLAESILGKPFPSSAQH